MIDLKDLRANPDKYRKGAADKGSDIDLDALLSLDEQVRALQTRQQELSAEKNSISKDIGQLAGRLKKASDADRAALQTQMQALQERPNQIKEIESSLAAQLADMEARRDTLWLKVPQPADLDVPVGRGSADNVQLSNWNPPAFDVSKPFDAQKGFQPKSHIDLVRDLGLVDFDRGVKIAGSRSYVLTGDGMRLHNAVLRYAFDFMTVTHGFTPLSASCLVRHHTLVGTGFFPSGRDQVYDIANPTTAAESGEGLALTGTGEVGLMAYHMDEILTAEELPKCYTTVSTCFRREAGAAGKDAAGLYRIHQFDKVEQVVICEADETISRQWHKKMIGYVEQLLQSLVLPYRLLQCCTGDLGPKNADMIDIECWMPSRGPGMHEKLDISNNYIKAGQPGNYFCHLIPNKIQEYRDRCNDDFQIVIWNSDLMYQIPFAIAAPLLVEELLTDDDKYNTRWYTQIKDDHLYIQRKGEGQKVNVSQFRRSNLTGDYGETHSASRLYDYQTRRLNLRYRDPSDPKKKRTLFCHSLNNTVAASPRILIPILEMYQNADGSVTVPDVLRPYMQGQEKIGVPAV